MARYSKAKGHLVYISQNTARRIIPILKWISEAAPRQKEKSLANSILKKIYKIEDWRQVILTKGETELLSFIRTEFPEGAPPEGGEQLNLFTIGPGGGEIIREKHSPKPPTVREKVIKPNLKTSLTREEQDEREKSGLPRLGPGQSSL